MISFDMEGIENTKDANGSAFVNKVCPKIVYCPAYDFKLFGLERLHPFDGKKFSRIWINLKQRLGVSLAQFTLSPKAPVSRDVLQRVHSSIYLDKLENKRTSSASIANALELLLLYFIPSRYLKTAILEPMKWATAGTVLAAEEVLQCKIAINLSGGYHHANQDHGEGFCIYSDVAVAIAQLRFEGKLQSTDKVIIIDLDAHQGNGLERIFADDKSIYLFDMYNQDIYPQDDFARQRIDHDVPISSGTDGITYLNILKDQLPKFLQSFNTAPALAFYLAGTDIFENDPLGEIKVTSDEILQRDLFVAKLLTKRGIPWVMLLSGGYTKESYRIVADSVINILTVFGTSVPDQEMHKNQ